MIMALSYHLTRAGFLMRFYDLVSSSGLLERHTRSLHVRHSLFERKNGFFVPGNTLGKKNCGVQFSGRALI